MKLQRVSSDMYRGSDLQTGMVITAKHGDTIDVSEPMAQYLQRTFPGDWTPAEAQVPPTAEPIQDRMIGVPIKRRPGRPRKVHLDGTANI